jgi:hypothetical protein
MGVEAGALSEPLTTLFTGEPFLPSMNHTVNSQLLETMAAVNGCNSRVFYIFFQKTLCKELCCGLLRFFCRILRKPHVTSVADPDPGSGIGYLFDSWIRDPGWEKVSIRIRDPG